jgi:ABC-type proline/glycine betaine transport system permease subunit
MLEKVFFWIGITGDVERILSTIVFCFLVGIFVGIWLMKKVEIGKNKGRN